jgi:hypothetical protein
MAVGERVVTPEIMKLMIAGFLSTWVKIDWCLFGYIFILGTTIFTVLLSQKTKAARYSIDTEIETKNK